MLIDLIVILAAFFGSILAGLFGGGAGLIFTPTIYLFLSYLNPQAEHLMQTSITTMIAALMPSGALSILKHHRYAYIRWSVLKWSAPLVILGAVLGCFIMLVLPSFWVKLIFAIATIGLAIKSTYTLYFALPKNKNSSFVFKYLGGLGLGVISTLSGSASFIVPYYEKLGLNIKHAIGTTTVVVWLYSLFVLLFMMDLGKQMQHLPIGNIGFLNYKYLVLFILPTIPGVLLGTRLAHQWSEHTLKRAFTALLYIIGLSMFFI